MFTLIEFRIILFLCSPIVICTLNKMDYKKCFIPTCKNDSINSPNKLIVRIREDLREEWCRQANVEYFSVYTMYCCEDHFDVKEDLRNFNTFKLKNRRPIFKTTAKLRLGINFADQVPNELNETQPNGSELLKVLLDKSTVTGKRRKYDDINMPATSGVTVPVKVQVAVQATVKMVDKVTNSKLKKTTVGTAEKYMHLSDDLSATTTETPSLFGCTSETETTDVAPHRDYQRRKIMLDMIIKKPKMYLGLPKPYLWLIEHIIEKSSPKIEYLSIIVTLLKIRQNDTLERISDEFEISRTKLSNMILTGVETLSNFFQNLIVCPSPSEIKKKLPLVFKIRYSNVQMIIDCFEIQISKPSNPLRQAQTWSQYKNCNTVKYLIGCTPQGLISFISKGYGGRISDKAIVENSNLLDILQPNAVVLADRGFKEIESLLNSHGVKLLRPPSVFTGVKQTLTESLQSKVIASLRVHVERVIRRVREFSILKPHSTVTYNYVPYLDEIVVIACGLINLQGEIIKSA